MNDKIFQSIFNLVQEKLPMDWKKLVLYISYTQGSYGMKYYVFDEKGKYIDCFSQKDISKKQLITLFVEIDKILAPERKALDEKDRWSVMSMIVFSDGKMKVEFDYTDISENIIAYEKEWQKKYL